MYFARCEHLSQKVLAGSVRAGSETGRAEVPAVGAALGLQRARGYAAQPPWIRPRATSLRSRDTELRYVSSSEWRLGHPPVARAQALLPCPPHPRWARSKVRAGWAEGGSGLDQRSFSVTSAAILNPAPAAPWPLKTQAPRMTLEGQILHACHPRRRGAWRCCWETELPGAFGKNSLIA